ncbi:uncharacterized protein ACRADG_005860 isoform 1-T2 [Cochliomyia hominivorax]
MSNKGKYIDRNPELRTAGKVFPLQETVGDSLKIYSFEEVAFNIINSKCRKQINDLKQSANLGYSQFLPNDTLKDLLCPELKKTRFVAFREKFAEDMFFKKPELGLVYPTQSKPDKFTNENFTYGLKNPECEELYKLVLPQKSVEEVKRDSFKWHDKYLISHKDFWPGERIKRNYNEHFDPQAIYGKGNNVDQSGERVKRCLQQCDRQVVINKVQKNFLRRTAGELGQKINRYNLNLHPDQTFGIRMQNPLIMNVRYLMENVKSDPEKSKIIEALCYVNKLRRDLYNRRNFDIYDLKLLLNKYDTDQTGFISFPKIMNALRSLQVYVNEKKIRLVVRELEILQNENQVAELVNIEKFWKMLHKQYPLPKTSLIPDLPDMEDYKQTTYRLLCSDREKSLRPQKSTIKTLKQIDDDQCRAKDLIAPDIPLHYGLAPSDFVILRPKQELQRIFKRLLNAEDFDKLWQIAGEEKMSVNDFRSLMEKYMEEYSK